MVFERFLVEYEQNLVNCDGKLVICEQTSAKCVCYLLIAKLNMLKFGIRSNVGISSNVSEICWDC